MSDLDALLGHEQEEPERRSRGRATAGTFLLAVVTTALVVALSAVLLYGLWVVGVALWDHFFDLA